MTANPNYCLSFEDGVRKMLARCSWDAGCLIQPVTPLSYGEVHWLGQRMSSHRASYQFFKGQIPHGLVVRHTCDRPPCCNPHHLILGTESQNVRDRSDRGRDPGHRRIGAAHPCAKLTPNVVSELRRLARDGSSVRALADDCGLPYPAVLRAVRGRTWQHVPEPPVPPKYRWDHLNPNAGPSARPEDVEAARSLYARGASLAEVGAQFGISRFTAWRWCGSHLEAAS